MVLAMVYVIAYDYVMAYADAIAYAFAFAFVSAIAFVFVDAFAIVLVLALALRIRIAMLWHWLWRLISRKGGVCRNEEESVVQGNQGAEQACCRHVGRGTGRSDRCAWVFSTAGRNHGASSVVMGEGRNARRVEAFRQDNFVGAG
jgi:hypothetical protein